MGALDLDFRRRPRPSPLGWLLLLLGLSAMAGVVAIHFRLEKDLRRLHASQQDMDTRLPHPANSGKNDRAQETLAAARKALEEAKLPWPGLFNTLESADNLDVAVLALTPDGGRQQVRIYAEARNLAAMLAYQRRLEQGGHLQQVTLVDHEASGESTAAPVRFHISAIWGRNHVHP